MLQLAESMSPSHEYWDLVVQLCSALIIFKLEIGGRLQPFKPATHSFNIRCLRSRSTCKYYRPLYPGADGGRVFEPFAAHVLVSEKRAADLGGDGAGVLRTATLLFSHLLDALQKARALFTVRLRVVVVAAYLEYN